MTVLKQQDFQALMRRAREGGVTLPLSVNRLYLANDAQPVPSTITNGGIPAIVAGGIDPNVIKTIFAPTRADEIYGERKVSAWEEDYRLIGRSEYSGEAASYGDYNDNGTNQVNVQWENFRQYRYQSLISYGDLEEKRYGLALINYVSEKQNAIANTLNIVRNKFAFYGVQNVCHGFLNDPSLPAPITPSSVKGATTWEGKSIQERYNDILALYKDLVARTNGAIGDGVDMASPLKLVLSNQSSVYLKSANESFNTSLEDMIRKAFPNMVIETAPQFSTEAGELVQMFLPSWGGQQSCYSGFSEKYRAHPVITHHSSWSQKVSAGTYGAIITQPMFFAQMLGI